MWNKEGKWGQRLEAKNGFHISYVTSLKKCESAVTVYKFQMSSYISHVGLIPQMIKGKERFLSVKLEEAVGREVEKEKNKQ